MCCHHHPTHPGATHQPPTLVPPNPSAPPTHPAAPQPRPPTGDFPDRVNGEIVAIQRVQTKAGEEHLRGLIEAHVERTGERG